MGRGRGSRHRVVLAPAAVLAAAVPAMLLGAGCGGGPTLTAQEFVQRINDQGVRMRLGQPLASGGDARELYAVTLPPLPGEPPPPPGSEGTPGASGSLYVFGDSGGAAHQLDACRHSGGLMCFQASNIVVVLDEEGSGLEARRLAAAIKRLAES